MARLEVCKLIVVPRVLLVLPNWEQGGLQRPGAHIGPVPHIHWLPDCMSTLILSNSRISEMRFSNIPVFMELNWALCAARGNSSCSTSWSPWLWIITRHLRWRMVHCLDQVFSKDFCGLCYLPKPYWCPWSVLPRETMLMSAFWTDHRKPCGSPLPMLSLVAVGEEASFAGNRLKTENERHQKILWQCHPSPKKKQSRQSANEESLKIVIKMLKCSSS